MDDGRQDGGKLNVKWLFSMIRIFDRKEGNLDNQGGKNAGLS
jgi:hypothetical protein